ncbi:MAG TPA: hypothetical protein DDY98_00890 [Ruminococcaceae bacterium]|nr:hypothetical protein [Oscillospiraceae bacterium]
MYGLNFASWYLGKEVADLFACCEAFHGIDSHTTVLMKYADGSIATISSATMLRTPNEGAVYGTKGYAKLEHFYAPEKLELFYADGSTETIETPYEGNGFEEQIRHVCSCISAGLTESPINTHEQTRFITRQMDEIRRKIGIVYPQDKD